MGKVRFAYLALAHVSHVFIRTGVVGLQAIDAFFLHFFILNFLKFYSCQPCFCFWLLASLFDQLFAAFSALCLLFCPFLLYVHAGSAASVHMNMQGGAVLFVSLIFTWPPSLSRRFRNLRLGPPAHI